MFDSTGGRPGFGGTDSSFSTLRGVQSRFWEFDATSTLDTGTEGAYSLNTSFNQGRWIAEVGEVLCWVYAVGGTDRSDLAGTVVLEVVEDAESGRGGGTRGGGDTTSTRYFTRVEFSEPGYTPALVVAPAGTDAGYMVVYIGEGDTTSVPLLYAWMPDESSATVEQHAPVGEVHGRTTARCGYPVGVVDEDGLAAFVVYTLSDVNYNGTVGDESADPDGMDSDQDPTRRVRMFCRTTDGGAIDDFQVDTDTEDAGYSHSHFPSVAVSSVELGSFGGEVWQFTMVMVVWRSYIPDPDPRDEADTDGWENYFSSIRGRVYIYSSGSLLGASDPFDVASPEEGGVYASDPSVVGLADGTFLIAFTAQSSTTSERGSVRTRTYSWPSGTLGEGGTLGEIAVVEEPDPVTGSGPNGTFPHKFPSLATNAAKDRVLMAYEVGPSGAQESHGTRMAAMHVADPTLWTIMPMTDGDGDGECDPTEDESTDVADVVDDLGRQGQDLYKTETPQQTINPCVVIRTSGSDADFLGFVFRDNLDAAEPAGTNTMSLRLYSVTVPW